MFSCLTISDKSLAGLGLQIEKHLPSRLQKIELNFGKLIRRSLNVIISFHSCPNITDAGLKSLSSGLSKNSRRLAELTIHFYQ